MERQPRLALPAFGGPPASQGAWRHVRGLLSAKSTGATASSGGPRLASGEATPPPQRLLSRRAQTSPSLWGSMLTEGSTPSSASGLTGPSPGSEPEPAAVFREDRSGSVTSVVVGA